MSNAVTDLHGWSVGAEDFLAAILESVAQPIWVVDADGVIRFANPAAVAALGYGSADELLGRPSHETIHHSHPDGTHFPAAECPMLLPRQTGERVARDRDWFFRRDGSGFPVSYVSVPLMLGDDGRGAVVAFTPREREATLAEEREALLRVATLVAGGAASQDVMNAVAREIGERLDLPAVEMSRLEPGGEHAVVVGAWGRIEHPFQPGTRWRLEGPTVTNQVRITGRPSRVENYAPLDGEMAAGVRSAGVHSAVGVPIIVEGELWGVIATGALRGESLPDDIEARLEEFTRLLAAAISGAQAREELDRIVDEQSALRRIATLVAQDAEPQLIFDAVCLETGRLLDASTVNLARFSDDGFNVTMAGWSHRGVHVPTGSVLPLDGDSINSLVRETRAPGRYDSYEDAEGVLATRLRELGVRSEVGAPVIVDGRVWGILVAGTDQPERLPDGIEQRLAVFAELIATAVSNASKRGELLASRARIVAAQYEQRRRVVRDIHDGAQQRLVHAVIQLQLAAAGDDLPPEASALVREALQHAEAAIEDLRELAHGIHPSVLTHYGLGAAVESLAERSPLPVQIQIPEDRFPPALESAAYFVVAEALTNVAKHAHADVVRVSARRTRDALLLDIADDGVGGATDKPGGGLAGLRDRVSALDGRLTVDSDAATGTRLHIELPLREPA
jgi:PAS domain S-box-containing protein